MQLNDIGIFATVASLILTPLVVGFSAWSQFKAADKNQEANRCLFVSIIVTLIFSFVAFYLIGSLKNLITEVTKVLNIPINLFHLILWTFILFGYPRFTKWITVKIVETKKIIKTSSKRAKKSNKTKTSKKPHFFDKLQSNLLKWNTVEGSPQISNIRGLPLAPSLLLEESQASRRNSFIVLKGLKKKNLNISCDIYLERDAVFNLVFRADANYDSYYMARIDTRSGGTNGILIANNKYSWGYIKQSGSIVSNDYWHHFELKVVDKKIVMTIDRVFVAEIDDSQIFRTGNIGMFNEVKRVFVNNFEIK